jgi:hypothetical protein
LISIDCFLNPFFRPEVGALVLPTVFSAGIVDFGTLAALAGLVAVFVALGM